MRKLTIRAAFIAVVAWLAYWAGQKHGAAQPQGNVSQNLGNKPSLLDKAIGPQKPPMLTRDQAWERWRTGVVNHVVFVDFLNEMSRQTNFADIPFLIKNLSTLPVSNDRDFAIESLFTSLAVRDPEAGLSVVNVITDPAKRNELTNRLLAMVAIREPKLALAELAKLPRTPATFDSYSMVFQTWSGASPDAATAAASAALALPAGSERSQALRGVAVGWAIQQPREALDWASALPDNAATLKEALDAASRADPIIAAQYLDKLSDASARSQIIGSISLNWSYRNPSAALDWLDQTATGNTYDQSVTKVFAGLSQRDPATAAVLLDKVTEPDVRTKMIDDLGTAWGRSNPQAALAWLQTLPDSDRSIRDGLVQKLTHSGSK